MVWMRASPSVLFALVGTLLVATAGIGASIIISDVFSFEGKVHEEAAQLSIGRTNTSGMVAPDGSSLHRDPVNFSSPQDLYVGQYADLTVHLLPFVDLSSAEIHHSNNGTLMSLWIYDGEWINITGGSYAVGPLPEGDSVEYPVMVQFHQAGEIDFDLWVEGSPA